MKLLKKAELSINMIVIVAISIVILVIMVFLITNRGGTLGDMTDCTSRGGVCVEHGRCNPDGIIGGGEQLCPTDKPVCCHPLEQRR